ncbi:MAG: hypothetical protein NTY04_02410, partial [Candidatus Staskawiczbacteria bacterium]|nr:hypothetical protein [Candidatus Staskawiczbacteria bacterium]
WGLWQQIVVGLSRLVLWGCYEIAAYSAYLLSYVVFSVMSKVITTDPAFTPAWATVRDLANMMIVLGFIIVGVGTSLRLREYEAKKLLGRLVLIALIINFSGLLCGLVIDASNIITTGLSGGNANMGENVLNNVRMTGVDLLSQEVATNRQYTFMANAALFGFVYLGFAFTFLYLGILIIARYAILIMLYILSPLAFICWVFPFQAAKEIRSKWWHNLIKWCFVGIFGSFVLYLVQPLVAAINTTDKSLISLFTSVTIVLIFLYAGFKMTAKDNGLASMAGSAITGLAQGAAGLAVGAVGAGSKLLADKTGMGKLGARMKDTATRAGEGLGLIKPGTTASNQQSRMNTQERNNRVASMTTEQKVAELSRNRMGHEAALDRAAITKNLAQTNQLGLVPDAIRSQRMAEAIQNGVREKDLVGGQQSTELATALNAGTTFSGDPEVQAERFKTLRKRGDLDLVTTHRQAAFNNAVAHGERPEEIEKASYQYAPQNVARRRRLELANPRASVADIDRLATDQALDEQLPNMNNQQLASVDAAHWTEGRINRLTPEKVRGGVHYATPDRRDRVRSLMPAIAARWAAAQAAAGRARASNNQTEADVQQREQNRLESLYRAMEEIPLP